MTASATGSSTLALGASRPRRLLRRIGFWLSLLVLVSPVVFVFLWMLSLSLKPNVENIAYPPIFIPRGPTLDNFRAVFENSPFGLYALNSFVVATASTLISLAVGVAAGYGIAKAKAHGLAAFVLISRMTPGLSYLIPWFMMFQTLRLNNTLW
ncbi:MAG: carbohydrate ABC transporter permease, partial [Geminicoccales bacterium]